MGQIPFTVGLSAWTIFVISLFLLVNVSFAFANRNDPDPAVKALRTLNYAKLFSSPFLAIAFAIAILHGWNWGRIGIMLLWVAGVTQEIVERSPTVRILAELGIAAVFAGLLFGPAANTFFGTAYF